MRTRHSKSFRVMQRQRGVALIMAILIVALATILAVNVASEGYMDQRRSSTMLGLDQALELSFGAEALAADVLQRDLKNNPKVDSLNEDWARQVELPVDEGIGEIKGNIEDLQGRFNLNRLRNTDGTVDTHTMHQLERLLELLQMDTKWAGIIADWIDADNIAQIPSGAEDTVYTAQTPPYLTANMPITRTSELLSLVGFGLDNYRKLEPYITALPRDAKLNVCTAPPLVLDSLASTISQYNRDTNVITTSRTSSCFPTKKDIDNSFKADALYMELIKDDSDYLSETTSYFRANILVSLGTTELTLYSVLHRTGSGKVQVSLRSFGTP